MKLAIVPARSGSKRLPRKNILPVLGHPILSYPITEAFKSALFQEVIVSTEDEEIAQIARQASARVLERPEKLAQDRATVVQVCLHVLQVLERENPLPEYFCCIYATALFVTSEDIQQSFQLLKSEPEADFVMGVSKFNLQPVQALVEKEGFLRPMWPEYLGIQSQFQPKLVASNGTIYWARTEAFLERKSFYGRKLRGYVIPRIRAVDIDTPEDLRIAQILAPHILQKEGSSREPYR